MTRYSRSSPQEAGTSVKSGNNCSSVPLKCTRGLRNSNWGSHLTSRSCHSTSIIGNVKQHAYSKPYRGETALKFTATTDNRVKNRFATSV